MDILAAHNTPFAVALALLALLLLMQSVGLSDFGGDFDTDVDGDIDVEGTDIAGGLASLLGLNRLPLMAWLSVFLGCFALLGWSGQQLIENLLGAPLPALPAAGLGLLIGVPATSLLARPLSKIWPHDETSAVSTDRLVGKRGTVSIGTARRGSPARVLVKDHFGQPHNVMVEPHEDSAEFTEGDEVLLVRREGGIFFAVTGTGPFRLD
ncbi:YqiJ family protein [Croceicoccus sp. Ery5]|uniref:YqiJ family protein n=1 Tax=Croceicoccus sp. Ery5 TaxID=1703340 RepID=UPI001E3A88E2|nr:YqiJ family protein [Croceicoccus sp. Ery5]